MKRVAIFGNTGGGKSTLARLLADITRLPLYVIDKIQFKEGGDAFTSEEYLQAHADILRQEAWIIDGFGNLATSLERFARADALIYVDLPLAAHYWWVTKRFIKGLFVAPEGWPKGSPLWSSTLNSYKVVRLCERDLAPRYRKIVMDEAPTKRVYHLKSRAEIAAFVEAVKREYAQS